MKQKVFFDDKNLRHTAKALALANVKKALLVCDKSFQFLNFSSTLIDLMKKSGIDFFVFDDIQPNPVYQSIEKGIKTFHEKKCDCIVAVGGGSSIDVAKCIKLFSGCDQSKFLLTQQPVEVKVPFFAFPSTAGSGSEATKFAVIYYEGEKQSISNEKIKPNFVVFCPESLATLPLYQKKSTVLDALCHAIEAFWSINCTAKSQKHSKIAIKLILKNLSAYLNNDKKVFKKMFLASYHAGKAIDVAQTTAAHAMSYKLTSQFGISHGHAVALCMEKLLPFVAQNFDRCQDARGQRFFKQNLHRLAKTFGAKSFDAMGEKFSKLLASLELPKISNASADIDKFADGVNLTRLKNFPVAITKPQIKKIYENILENKK